jgi:hypothetical protein
MKNPLKNDPIGFLALTVVGLLLLCLTSIAAHAEPILLGKFGEDEYYYEKSTVTHQDNIVFVWVFTVAPRFNIFRDEDYLGGVGKLALDCSGHNSAFLEGMILDRKGKILHERTVPEQDWAFFSIKQRTVQDKLYRELCVMHTVL